MNTQSSFEKCLGYIGAQLEAGTKSGRVRPGGKSQPSVTISRQAGAGGIPIAEHLAEYLNARAQNATALDGV